MKPSKYRNIKVECDGIHFDSKRERVRYQELKLLERAGEIKDLTLQPQVKFCVGGRKVVIRSKGYPNGRQVGYKADFRYTDCRTGQEVWEDVKAKVIKGKRHAVSRDYPLRKAFLEAIYGIQVKEV